MSVTHLPYPLLVAMAAECAERLPGEVFYECVVQSLAEGVQGGGGREAAVEEEVQAARTQLEGEGGAHQHLQRGRGSSRNADNSSTNHMYSPWFLAKI